MASIVFSLGARLDIVEAFQQSTQQFGSRRTVKYFAILDAELDRLAKGFRLTAVPVRTVPGLLRYRVARHYVFFLPTDSGIFVSRFVHTARSQAQQQYPLSDPE